MTRTTGGKSWRGGAGRTNRDERAGNIKKPVTPCQSQGTDIFLGFLNRVKKRKGENKMKKSFVCACGKKFKTYNLYWFHLCSVGHSKKHYAVTATKQRQNDKMFKSGFDCCVE